MNIRTRHQEEQPTVAGLSLVLYLLVSLLSMLAFAETSKANEDVRSSIVHTLQSGQQSPTKSGGDDADEWVAFHAPGVTFEPRARARRVVAAEFNHVTRVTTDFDARGPPVFL